MILLDTNVVSEPLKPSPDERVLRWLRSQATVDLYISTVTVAELSSGVELLPQGKRRTLLTQGVEAIFKRFSDRTLSLDFEASRIFSQMLMKARSKGNQMGFADCAIASIALKKSFALATRDVSDFRGAGLRLINPWEAE